MTRGVRATPVTSEDVWPGVRAAGGLKAAQTKVQCGTTCLAVQSSVHLSCLVGSSPSLEYLYMEYEEDDDISFAKWMSSFWGHSVIDEKEGRGHRKRQTRPFSERRASLPAKLSSIHMTRLQASTKTPSSGHLRGCKEFQEGQDIKCHCHMKACKISSPEGPGSNSRSSSIQEFSESFEKQLHFKNKRSFSLQPDGMKERRERARLCVSRSRSHKKEGEKREPKKEQEDEEDPVALLGNEANSLHHKQALKRDISSA